jgi:hypothetical protein
MTLSKFTKQPANKEIVDTINDIIETMSSTTGANIDLSNLSTTGNAKFQVPLESGTNIKTINNTSLLGSGNISVLQNTATGTNALTIGGTATQKDSSVNIGVNSSAIGASCVSVGNSSTSGYGNTPNCVSIGASSYTNGKYSTAVGCNAQTSAAEGAIQLGYGMNTTANTLSIGFNGSNLNKNWQLLDGSTGLIPDARISTNIARSSDVANTTLSNVSSIDSNSAVQTALDGKVSKSGDTMTGDLTLKFLDFDLTTTPSSNTFHGIEIVDTNGSRIGRLEGFQNTNGDYGITIGSKYGTFYPKFVLNVNSQGKASCSFPNTTCCDGHIVSFEKTVAADVSLAGSSNLTYTLALPDDDYSYLVLFNAFMDTGSSSGNYARVDVSSDICDNVSICRARTRTASTMQASGAVWIPVSSSHKIYVGRVSTWVGTFTLKTHSYRRVGTNG